MAAGFPAYSTDRGRAFHVKPVVQIPEAMLARQPAGGSFPDGDVLERWKSRCTG
jgi:hypothetical protein